MNRVLIILIILCSIQLSCKKDQSSAQVYPTTTLSGNWDVFNKSRIENLIDTYGKRSSNYNSLKPPYVIFDWDNTCTFWDTEEATMIYQIINLKFGCTPEELDQVIRTGVDTNMVFAESGVNFAVKDIANDIKGSFTWLYQNYSGLGGGGSLSLEQVKLNPH